MTLPRILYVDDEPNMRLFVKMALENDYAVQDCASGAEAVSCVREGRFLPDLILLDFQMPGMDGGETLRALRQIPGMAAVPAVMISGDTGPEELEHFKRLGAAGMLDKAMDLFLLPGAIAGFLGAKPP